MKKNSVLNSSILMIGASWLTKALGLVSTIFLARLLTPSDFGLVAITMLVIYFFTIFSETGFKQYLLSLSQITTEDLHTAWTLNISSKAITSLFLIFVSPYAADFFEQPLLLNTLLVSSLIPLINGLENPAIYLAKREFNYSGIFKLNVISKIISFSVTLSLAYYLRSHWALIYGTLVHFSIMSIGSYFIYPFNPYFTLIKFNEQWNYSKWIFLRGLVGYARAKIDTFILAKLFTTLELGFFNIAKEFAMLLYEQIALPICEIVMTSVRKVKSEPKQVILIIEKYFILLSSILLPAVIGLSFLSTEIIVVLLGEQWYDSGELLEILAFLGFSSALVAILSASLSALSKTKLVFYIDLISTLFIVIILLLFKNSELYIFTGVRAGLGYIVLFAYLLGLKYVLNLKVINLFIGVLPSLFCSSVMLVSLIFFQKEGADVNLLNLLVLIGVAFFTYLLSFWLVLAIPYNKSEALLFVKEYLNKMIKMILKKAHIL